MVLDGLKPSLGLRILKISVRPGRRYGFDRSGLLDCFLGDKTLARNPALRQLHLVLLENDARYNSGWWTTEIERRLQGQLVSVQVDLRLDERFEDLWANDSGSDSDRHEAIADIGSDDDESKSPPLRFPMGPILRICWHDHPP
ncbi:hypothetical protein C8Q76DRAFT_798090 [Earliella scabrosa]|nr:hypothetical protein C8Q76DRAFT_798090 [Earliella scabrosa]